MQRFVRSNLIFLYALFVYLPCYGQQVQQAEDTFLLKLKKARADTLKVQMMCDFSWSIRLKSPQKSFEYAQKAHKLARQIDHTKGIIKSLGFMGIAMRNLGN